MANVTLKIAASLQAPQHQEFPAHPCSLTASPELRREMAGRLEHLILESFLLLDSSPDSLLISVRRRCNGRGLPHPGDLERVAEAFVALASGAVLCGGNRIQWNERQVEIGGPEARARPYDSTRVVVLSI